MYTGRAIELDPCSVALRTRVVEAWPPKVVLVLQHTAQVFFLSPFQVSLVIFTIHVSSPF